MDAADEARPGRGTTRGRTGAAHTTLDGLPVGGPKWPIEAVSVLLIFGFLLAITVLGATVTTSRVSRDLDAARAGRDRARDRVDELERDVAELKGERDMLAQRARDGATGSPLPVRLADHLPGIYVVGNNIAPGRWVTDTPACTFVRADIASGTILGQGDATGGVMLAAGEQVTFGSGECWWHFEGS